ncbi:hypothetical protein ARMGADRAFT_444287 [Armillaria gallica]|uniref:Uncharacterized protein n=1 Tax=Armillaria gallica TaxID=47427 RepID=A0A2H3D225_ARMGA|nr:hypothetical protein ARMGADRAFT_444287 [Armillaria gallica]
MVSRASFEDEARLIFVQDGRAMVANIQRIWNKSHRFEGEKSVISWCRVRLCLIRSMITNVLCVTALNAFVSILEVESASIEKTTRESHQYGPTDCHTLDYYPTPRSSSSHMAAGST